MKNLTHCTIFAISLLLSTAAFAQGYITKNAIVTRVSATSTNVDAFWVHYENASNDNCNSKVRFYRNKAGTDGVFERSFSLATTTSGMFRLRS